MTNRIKDSDTPKVIITYGTFDLFHVGHLNLLEKLRSLGDRVLVGVSTDEFNAIKGKETVIPYAQRVRIVGSSKYVHAVFPEHSWHQKRADIAREKASVFAMGDDWVGKFDDLSDCCEVMYLPRSKDISTSDLKAALIQNALASKIDEITRASERLNALVDDLSTVPSAMSARLKALARAS